jgi:GntR family transcriptional regulator
MAQAIDPTSDRPVYKQIADLLRAGIQSGELGPGARLPSEQELIDAHGVARGTIRQAVRLLASEGLLEVQHGRGAFVRDRPPVRRLGHDRFAREKREQGKAGYLADMESQGREPGVEVLEVGQSKASEEIAGLLGIEPGDNVLVRRRRYLADGTPMQTASSYIPWGLAEGTRMTQADTGPGGIYARLEEAGHRLERFTEDVVARMPTEDEARTLLLGAGVPVIRLVRTAYDTAGLAVEVCDTVMAADRYLLSYELPAD